MASVDRSNYINFEMICAATMYEMFINRIIQSDDGKLSNLDDISLNFLERYASDTNKVFLDLLVANISMLLPILMDEYLEKGNTEELFSKYGEFFKRRESDYSYLKSRRGNILYEIEDNNNVRKAVNQSLNNFRIALEHGIYEITYDNEDAYIIYKYAKSKDNFVYKKVPLSVVISIISEMVDFNYLNNNTNRLAFGILSNMKLIYQQLKSKHNFNYHYELLEGRLFKEDDVSYFEDMKYASSFLAFYVYYQKHLEIAIGPMVIDYKTKTRKNGKDITIIPSELVNNVYLDLSTLDLGELEDTALVNVDVLDFETLISRYDSYFRSAERFVTYNNKYNEVEKNNMLKVINARRDLLVKYRSKLNVLHHIRNSFAHGRVTLVDDEIHIVDIGRNGNVTYENVVSIDAFKVLLSMNNLSLIGRFLKERKNGLKM